MNLAMIRLMVVNAQATLETARMALDDAMAEQEAAASPDSSHVPSPDGTQSPVCEHPPEARRPAAVMGHPRRFYCTACDTTVEGD